MDFFSMHWSSFLYSAIILAILVAALIARRDLSFGKTLKYLLIWAIIAIIAIIIYSYRYNFLDLKNRILRELNPSTVSMNEKGQLSITMSKNGHFYVNIKVNGAPIKFMVDTGASDTTLSLNDAKKAKINIKELSFDRRYQTANGVIFGAKINLEEVEIGNVKLRNISASVNNSDMGVSLLGMSFLRQCKKYEFYRNKLVLTF